MVGVDDPHHLDAVTATLVHQFAADRVGRLLLTVRSGERAPAAVTALWKDGLLERLDVPPTAEPETGRLLEAGLGGAVDGPSRRRLHAVTEGNVLWLQHLVEGERRAGRLIYAGGEWSWHGRREITPALGDLIDTTIGEPRCAHFSALLSSAHLPRPPTA